MPSKLFGPSCEGLAVNWEPRKVGWDAFACGFCWPKGMKPNNDGMLGRPGRDGICMPMLPAPLRGLMRYLLLEDCDGVVLVDNRGALAMQATGPFAGSKGMGKG